MDQRVQRVILIINENLTREPSLGELAQAINLSPSRMSHVFKTELGISPKQYLKLVRIQRAKELLLNSFLSVKEIARRVGARDESHFVRDFKKECGLTPTQYRASRSLQTATSSAANLANR